MHCNFSTSSTCGTCRRHRIWKLWHHQPTILNQQILYGHQHDDRQGIFRKYFHHQVYRFMIFVLRWGFCFITAPFPKHSPPKTSDHWHQVLNVINQKRFFSTCLNHKTNSWWRIAVWMVFYFNFLPSVSIHFVRVYLVKIACKPWEIKAMWSQKNRKKKKNNF